MEPLSPPNNRTVHCEDALAWLSARDVLAGCSIVTSMPDHSEFSSLTLDQWKEWFVRAATLTLSRCPDDGVTIFYQTDIKKDGVWIDKGYLCQKAAEQTGHSLLWHKVVCRAPAGKVTFGRPAYSHILCFSRGIRADVSKSTVDVLPQAGEVTWTRGMGVEACLLACRYILENTQTRTVVDPFCGHGTVLAVANELGMNAVGVELGPKRARKARSLKMIVDGASRILATAALCLTFTLPTARADAEPSKWVQVGSSDGISIFRKEIPNDPVFAYKGEGILAAPFGKLVSVSLDVSRQHEWVNRLDSARIIHELAPDHRVIYLKIDSPWPVSDRDFVIDLHTSIDRTAGTAIFDIHSVEDPLYPPNKCCVRGIVHSNHIELRKTDEDRTSISAEAHVDPRGSLPAWIINLVQKTFPHKSIGGLLKQVRKPDIQDYFSSASAAKP